MIQLLAPLGMELIKRFIPDKDAQVEAQAQFNQSLLDGSWKEFEQQAGIIMAEANSKNWLTSSWRPITMLTFVVIIANNYILYPYLSLFWPEAPTLEIPPDMWALLKIGLGGYVVGRSGEKIAQVFKK